MKKLLFIFIVVEVILTAQSEDFVVHSTESIQNDVIPSTAISNPIVYDMDIQSNVSNRFAKTLVTSRVKNPSTTAQETTFTVVLPEKAFISEFILQTEDKEYKAYVKEKEEALQIYNQAVQRGQTAGHVSVSARDSNKFTVSVNIEPEAKASFLLTYEELLERKNNQYELLVNIHPGQVVDNLHVQVYINESRPLTFVKTPSLRSGNEIAKNSKNLDPSSDIQIIEKKTATVKFTPDAEQQKRYAKELGTKESDGLSGQFVVQYDVERDPNGGEVLLQDGYFIHFFAPDNLAPLSKYIVFVLDTSGSMGWGTNKIGQLKDAMKNILDQLKPGDYVSLIEFNTVVYGWNIESESTAMIAINNYEKPFDGLNVEQIPRPSAVGNQTITKAKNVIQRLQSGGGTNIIAALEVALACVKLYSSQIQETDKNLQPIIMFLTDGEPVGGISNTNEITRIVSKLNSENNHVPIYSLSFGDAADKDFLRKISLKNSGFSRHIYEASDASLQLQNFYKEISSPVLSNIKFKYHDAINVTKVNYPVLYKGSEIIVGGCYLGRSAPTEFVKIHGFSDTGKITLKPQTIVSPVSSLERLWAYLTIKQKLDQRDIVHNKEKLSKEALDLALKYSFVTDVTSLVVVKPNDTQKATLETARPDSKSDSDRILTPIGPPKFSYTGTTSRPHYPVRPYPLQVASIGGSHPRPAPSRIGWPNTRPSPASRPSYSPPALPSSYEPSTPPGLRTKPLPLSRPSPHLGFAIQNRPQPSYHFQAPTSTSALGWKVPTTSSAPKLQDSLPWLTAALNSNGTLTVKGDLYKVEENYRSTSDVGCPQTPLNVNDSGSCKLLKDCPEVYSYLTDFNVYQQYFCAIDISYAGVCCPKKIASEP